MRELQQHDWMCHLTEEDLKHAAQLSKARLRWDITPGNLSSYINQRARSSHTESPSAPKAATVPKIAASSKETSSVKAVPQLPALVPLTPLAYAPPPSLAAILNTGTHCVVMLLMREDVNYYAIHHSYRYSPFLRPHAGAVPQALLHGHWAETRPFRPRHNF